MTDISWEEIEKIAKVWIKQAGEQIRQASNGDIDVNTKSNADDLVTNMDLQIERFFIRHIHKRFPGHRILGEEGYGDEIPSHGGTLWVIDPIDGTMNFVHQKCNYAISIGIFHHGQGKIGLIYDVTGDELFHCISGQGAYVNGKRLKKRTPVPLHEAVIGLNATWVTENHRIDPKILSPLVGKVRGTRSYGTAAIELAYIAANRLDAYFSMRLAPWDFAAGKILLEEVGAVITVADGEPIDLLKQNSIFAGERNVHHEILTNYIQKGIQNHMYMERKQ